MVNVLVAILGQLFLGKEDVYRDCKVKTEFFLKKMYSRTNKNEIERRKIRMLGKTAKEKQVEDKETEYASYEICRKSKVGEYIQTGQEFFVADMKKKKIYSSNDLRLRELAEKVDSEDTFVFKEANYM